MQAAPLGDASVVITKGREQCENCGIGAVVNSSFQGWKAAAVVPFCHSSHFLADSEADKTPCCSSE
jgi:hypothetical protein